MLTGELSRSVCARPDEECLPPGIASDSTASVSQCRSRASPWYISRSCCVISASSSRCRLSSASRSWVFCGSSISLPNRLVSGSLLPFNDESSQSIIALEAVSVDSPYRQVTFWLTQDNTEGTVTAWTLTSEVACHIGLSLVTKFCLRHLGWT